MRRVPSIYHCDFKDCTWSVVPPSRECEEHSKPKYAAEREAAHKRAVDWWRDLCNTPSES